MLVVALSQIFSFSIRYASGQPFTAFVFLMNSVLPVMTAFPISVYIFRQNARLKQLSDELKKANHMLQIRADTDSMTGLLNRSAFLTRIKPLNKQSSSSACLIIDADNFKSINDIYGHHAGDKALQAIVSALKTPLRKTDILARIGGEEFALFLPQTDVQAALTLAEQLRITVENLSFSPLEDQIYPLSISIGIALSDGSFTTSQLMRMADQSLYQAKAKGRNQVVLNLHSLNRHNPEKEKPANEPA